MGLGTNGTYRVIPPSVTVQASLSDAAGPPESSLIDARLAVWNDVA